MIFTTLPSSKIISMKNLSNLSGSIDQDLFLNNQTKDKIENIKIHYSKPVEFVNIGKSENYYDIASITESINHENFLLLSSVNSIRFWSVHCAIHQSRNLFTNSTRRSYNIAVGISGMSIYRTENKNIQLLWFDVPQFQLYRGEIYRNEYSNECSTLLKLENIQPVHLDSNVPIGNGIGNNFVQLAIDSDDELLFMLNVDANQIDIYRINDECLLKNELPKLVSFNSTKYATNIKIDITRKILFWIESGVRICRMNYTNLKNLIKNCTNHFVQHRIVAMSLDQVNEKMMWADESSRIMLGSYQMNNESEARNIYQSALGKVTGIMLNNQRLFVRDKNEVEMVYLEKEKKLDENTILIESQAIFETLFIRFDENDSQIGSNHLVNEESLIDRLKNYKNKWSILIFTAILLLLVMLIVFLFVKLLRMNECDRWFNTIQQYLICWPKRNCQDKCLDDNIIATNRNMNSKQIDGNVKIKVDHFRGHFNNKYSIPRNNKLLGHKNNCDIEDLTPILNADQDYCGNPFLSCKSCPEPKNCHELGICLATYRQVKL